MKTEVPAGPSAPPAAGAEVQQILYPYGVGVDTHSRFIQACVLKVSPDGTDRKSVVRLEAEFKTDWRSLLKARDWVLSLLPEVTDPTAGGLPQAARHQAAGAGGHSQRDGVGRRLCARQTGGHLHASRITHPSSTASFTPGGRREIPEISSCQDGAGGL
jgi:hypothetical protein